MDVQPFLNAGQLETSWKFRGPVADSNSCYFYAQINFEAVTGDSFHPKTWWRPLFFVEIGFPR